MGVGAVDPLTDVSAENFSRLVSDLAALAHTAPFAVITYLTNDTSPAAPTIETVYMMTDVRTSSYEGDAAPAGFPSATRNNHGDVTFTFSSSYNDDYGVAGALSLRHATATAHDTTDEHKVCVSSIPSSVTARVKVFDDSAVRVQDVRVTVVIY